MQTKPTRVLFVSKNNAARGLIAEACLRKLGGSLFQVFSCGVPEMIYGKADPSAIAALVTAGFDTSDLYPKDWGEFRSHNVKAMNIVITLDAEVQKLQPIWPGQPETALWEYSALDRCDQGSKDMDIRTIHVLHSLARRLDLLVNLRKRVHHHTELRHDIRDLAHL
jgi:arsenate reductase